MMKETGIDNIYEDFLFHGYIHAWEDFDFAGNGEIITIQVIEIEQEVRLFICVNGQVKKTEILANYGREKNHDSK